MLLTCSLPVYSREVKSAWDEFIPYSYEKKGDVKGIDIDFLLSIMNMSGFSVKLSKSGWGQSLQAIESGGVDVLPGATFTDERSQYSYFTAPYRVESNAILIRKNPRVSIRFITPSGFIEEVQKTGFKLGVIEGYAFPEPVISEYVKKTNLLKKSSSKELVNDLISGKIDGFITDSNEARKILSSNSNDIASIPTNMKTQIRLMLAKKNFTKKEVEQINQNISKFTKSKLYLDILKSYSSI